MRTSVEGRRLIEKAEGCKLHAYQDSVGVWTIGYGHTAGVHEGMMINTAQADAFLADDLADAERAVDQSVRVELKQGEFDALVSFVFNLGARAFEGSTLLKKLNRGDKVGAAGEFTRWNMAGGRPLRGLVLRRWREAGLFLGVYEI